MPDNSHALYLEYYFKFQQGFKPVQTFQVQKCIIIEAMKTLTDVMKNNNFFNDIELIYPNYFTEKEGGQYQPIADDLVFFNTAANEDLKNQVKQHMSYYLVPRNSVKQTDTFVRISKSLIQSGQVSLSSFFVRKNNDKYNVKIHNGDNWDSEAEIHYSKEFPDHVDNNLLNLKFIPSKQIIGWSELSVQGEDLVSLPEGAVDNDQFNSSETFAKVFQKPLSAHFVMLQNASLLYVYSQTAQIDKSNNLGYGGLFILLKANLSDETIEQYRRFFQLISDSISICIAHNIMREKQLREAVKSAKAAIMSRNLSHNLGSHVMSYLKKHLSSVATLLQDNVLSDFITAEEYNSLRKNQQRTFTKSFSKVEEGIALPFLVGLGNFISYLQERQDFIATIATDYIPYYSTVNFKDFIYDELNPDKRFFRHKDRKNLRPDNILLGNIARSEGLGRPTNPTESEKEKIADIVIKFEDFDGDPVVNDGNTIIEKRGEAAKSLDRMRDVNISLPGGLVGRQAIFSIVENIVRNAAKHGNWRSKGKLELTFNIYGKEELEDIIGAINRRKEDGEIVPASSIEGINNETIDIDRKLNADAVGEHYSLKKVLWLFYSGAIDIQDLYIVTITDNSVTSFNTVADIRKALKDEYINQNNGVMREENKGIKELRISAAWLRGARDESEYYYPIKKSESDIITEPQRTMKAPLMYVRLSNNKPNADSGHLQYIFCLRIPKKVAIVSNEEVCVEAKKQLIASYWNYYSLEQFIEAKNKSFDFVLCDKCYKEARPYSTSKIVDIEQLEPHGVVRDEFFAKVKSGILPEDCNTVELALYNHFSLYEEDDFICIDDKKAYSKVCQEDGWSKPDNSSCGLSEGKTYMKKGHVVVTDGGGCGAYVYRTHHDSIAEFDRFMNELKNNFADCRFVESITGNTSTDRLVRNSVLDDRWFYAHLRAMKMKVAIFDERLFSNISGLQEVSFTHAKLITKGIEDMKNEYISLFGSTWENTIKNYNDPNELNKYVTSIPYFRKQLYEPTAVSKGNAAASFYQKGICFFTLIRDVKNENKYGLYGLDVSDPDKDVLSALILDDGFSSTFMKLADLEWDAENKHFKEIKLAEGGNYLRNGFDYITIHQGLLDKLYEAFGIQKTDVESKDNLTKDLYLLLKRVQLPLDTDDTVSSILEKEIITNGGRVFLPGITIHSGRSKPSSSDMPQLLPFIQYAAIEHATMDCKFSLVELLDNARYE